MQNSTIISISALIVAIIALTLSLTRNTPSEAEIDKVVDAALIRKERQYVEILAPKMDQLYKDMIYPYTSPAKPPETFGELFLPALRILNGLHGISDSPKQQNTAEQDAAANP